MKRNIGTIEKEKSPFVSRKKSRTGTTKKNNSMDSDNSDDEDLEASEEEDSESAIDVLDASNDPVTKSVEEEVGDKSLNLSRFGGYEYSHSSKLQYHVRETFKRQVLPQIQLCAMNAAIMGSSCFVMMSSDSGKSMIYQLPAIMSSGVTLVVSPKVDLIEDQLKILKSLGIRAEHMKCGIKNDEIFWDLSANEPEIKILYTTAEKIEASPFFVKHLKELYARDLLARIVVDEAQCIIRYGENFRKSYSTLYRLAKKFPEVPWTLLAGAALTSVSRRRIIGILKLNHSMPLFLSSIDRPNLQYNVVKIRTPPEIVKLITAEYKEMCGIVFCSSQSDTGFLANKLLLNNINALPYHNGLSNERKKHVHDMWRTDKVKVICATEGFGMGIYKTNVRFIIHTSLPKSLEQYYADCNHAGLDGKTADCILYYAESELDLMLLDAVFGEIDGLLMTSYCTEKKICRRKFLLNHFGQSFSGEKCGCGHQGRPYCDICEKKSLEEGAYGNIQ